MRQSGVPGLHTAALGVDMAMLSDAQDAVQQIKIADPGLEDYPALRAYVERVLEQAAGRLE